MADLPVSAQGFAHALGAGGSDALADRTGRPQLRGGFAKVAVLTAAIKGVDFR